MLWRISGIISVWILISAELALAQGNVRAGHTVLQRQTPPTFRSSVRPTSAVATKRYPPSRPRYPRPAGTSNPLTCLRVPLQYTTIQSAIDAAFDGDTILISEGKYFENINYRGKAITVGSLYLADGDTSHIDRTIIDGSRPTNPDSGSVVSFVNGEEITSVLCGLTIRGGKGTTYSYNGYLGSFLARQGGGVFFESAGARLVKNFITQNRVVDKIAAIGGGVGANGTAWYVPYLILEGNRITENYVQGDSLGGLSGGADICGAAVLVIGNVFERDSAVGGERAEGGGLRLSAIPGGEYPEALIQGNIFRANSIRSDFVATEGRLCVACGGGIELLWTGGVRVLENQFESNSVRTLSGSVSGGGIDVHDDGLPDVGRKLILRNRFVGNKVESQSGFCAGGGICLGFSKATVNDNFIADNIAVSNGQARGGGVQSTFSDFRVENCTITRNSVSHSGGGIDIYSPPMQGTEQVIVNTIISANSSGRNGGGISAWGPGKRGSLYALSNTIVSNAAWIEGGGMFLEDSVALVLVNSILWNNVDAGGVVQIVNHSPPGAYYYNDIKGGWSQGAGNISLLPQFADSTYRLSDSSACIGSGIDSTWIDGAWVHAPGYDCSGSPRPSPPNSHPDIGAWEHPLAVGVNQSALQFRPLGYDFQNVHPGSVSDTLSIVITNRGVEPKEIRSAALRKSEFSLCPAPVLPLAIPPFGEKQLAVVFRPTVPGAIIGDTLVVSTSDPALPQAIVLLSGRGSGEIQSARSGGLYGISASSGAICLFKIDRGNGSAKLSSQFGPQPPSGLNAFTVRYHDNALYGASSSGTGTDLYRLSSEYGDLELSGQVPVGDVTSMAFSESDVLYLVTTQGRLYRVRESGMDTVFVGSTGHALTGLAFSPATKVLWGSVHDSVFTVDTSSAVLRLVSANGWVAPHSTIAFSGLGTMYAMYGERLVVIDKIWGAATEVGATGVFGLMAIAMRSDPASVDVVDLPEQPLEYQLFQNYPNPFNPSTTVRYSLRRRSFANLTVYNTLGQHVATVFQGEKEAGYHEVKFDATGLSSGVYFYRLRAGDFVQTRKLLLIR